MTAVEWLEYEINRRGPRLNNPPPWLQELYDQALEMEKKQIKDAYNQGYRDGGDKGSGKDISLFDDANLYYNETYNKP